MADEKTFTQADIEVAVSKAEEGLKAKVAEALDEVKALKTKLRAASEITPEEMAKVEAERDKALAELNDAKKQIGTLAKERDAAAKALESEQGAARTYALDAEISSAIAAGNVVPALVPAFKALLAQSAKADLVDGKYAVTIGEKPAGEYIKTFLDSDDGKAYRAMPTNGGGGAPGGGGNPVPGAKTVDRATFDGMSHVERASFAKEGGKVVDKTA